MKVFMRPVLASLALILGSVGVVLAGPQWAQDFGSDIWGYLENERAVRQNAKDYAELDRVNKQVRNRVELKMSMTRSLVEERMTLAEAVDHFIDLNASFPPIMSETRTLYPANSDEESVALQVLAFVKVELEINQSANQLTLEQIDMQIREMQGESPPDTYRSLIRQGLH